MNTTIETLLEAREIIPVDHLVTLAGDRRAAGDDVRAAVVAQAELRQRRATALVDEGDKGGGMLASQQREHDRHIREIEQILGLARLVEQRSDYRVPESQVLPTSRPATVSAVVPKGGSVRDWLTQRGGAHYAGERGAESMRFGAVVRALALGDRSTLTPLEQRALSEGIDASGGFTVPELLSTSFIDRVRNSMVCMRAGAVTVPMTSDNLSIARLAQPDSVSPSNPGPTWHSENDIIEDTDITLERVRFQARTMPMLIRLSVELSEDSANVDEILEQEMSAAMALELDRVCLLGSGTAPEPRGILNQSGVSVESFGGVTPSNYDFMIDAIGRVWGRNHEPNSAITNAALATAIAKFKSTGDDQPLRVPEVVAALQRFRTNTIPSAGTSPDSTSLFLGDFTKLLIGVRTSFRLEVSRVAGDAFDRLQVAVRAYLRCDVQLAHAAAFDVTTDVGLS